MSDELRRVERDSIRAFIESHAVLMSGKLVLDLGCGQQPYRDIVERADGMYVGYDRPYFKGSVVDQSIGSDPTPSSTWGVVLCTQVIQYVERPHEWLTWIRGSLNGHGRLLMTGPTNWPIVESDDLRRYTPAGIAYDLERAGFTSVQVSERATWKGFLLGWGAVACS